MKKLKSLKTGILSRNIALAKLATKVGKDLYLSKKEEVTEKVSDTLLKRTNLIKGELGELKGSFLKAGQLLSMYAQDILPKEFNDLLIELQGKTSYLEWEAISKQIPQKTLDELEIEKNALAAASIGQVHRAFLNETPLALKIQYKKVEKLIDTDLWILKKLLSISKVIPKAYDFDGIFEEIRRMLMQEMDYESELAYTQKFFDLAKDDYIIPKVYPEYSDRKTLCLEFIDAQDVDDYLVNCSEDEKIKLAREFFTLFLKEIFEWKLVQSDAHAGNFFIKDGKWVLIDFGAVKEVKDEFYPKLIHSLITRDKELLINALKEEGSFDLENTDIDFFWEHCKGISEPMQDYAYDWEKSDIVNEVMGRSKELQNKIKFHRIPSENIFIDRKIGGVYFMLKKIGVSINLHQVYMEFIKELQSTGHND